MRTFHRISAHEQTHSQKKDQRIKKKSRFEKLSFLLSRRRAADVAPQANNCSSLGSRLFLYGTLFSFTVFIGGLLFRYQIEVFQDFSQPADKWSVWKAFALQ